MKKEILKIAVVLVVLFFIFEPIAIGIIGRANPTPTNQSAGSQIQGAIQFNATLESYDPYLLATTLDANQKESIKQLDGVEDVISIDNGYAISLKKSIDIPKVYLALKELNLTTYANANLQMPDSVEITAGLITLGSVSTGGALIKMVTEPLITEGETVELKMSVAAQNGFLVSYSAPSFVPKSSSFEVDANVLSFEFIRERYLVPWEFRDSINTSELKKQYHLSNITYSKKNLIEFINPLTVDQLKNKPAYISIINQKGATVDANFVDKNTILVDFGNNVIFPVSTLEINTNKSTELNLTSAEKSTKFVYKLLLTNLSISDSEVIFAFDNEKEIGSKVKLNISAIKIGKTITTISDIKLVQ